MKRKYNVRVKGDELIIIVIKDTPYIVVDGLISSFGLSYNQSILDLKSNHDLKSIEISNDGNVQKKISIPLANLYFWLITITEQDLNDESKKKVEFYRKIGCATLYRYWLNIQKEVNKNEEISRKIEKNQTMINVNNYSGRLLLTVANGEIINSSSLSEDSFILKKDKINKLIEEPGILTVNEIIMINRSLQNRINDLLGVK